MKVHPTSIIGPKVELASDVEVGPFCIIQGDVTIGAGSKLMSHVVLGDERTKVVVGKNNVFYPGSVVGGPPQDLSYKNEKHELIIGDNNTIREFVTINVGTTKGGGITRIASNCLLMAYVHIAHDCQIGSHVVIANSCQFAGHVHVEDHVKIGGVCQFNQFVVLGKYSYVAGDSAVNKDIPPFTIAQGKYAVIRTANEIGMDRSGFDKAQVASLRKAVRILTKGKLTLDGALARIAEECEPGPCLNDFVAFIKSEDRKRGLAI